MDDFDASAHSTEFSITSHESSANSINLQHSFKNEAIRRLYQIESKNLNSDNEMIKMFGARIVQAERQNAQAAAK